MTRARDLAAGTFEQATGGVLKLETSDTTVTDGSVLGKIEFKAPDEASGTDAILVGAAIEAVAEGTFAADNNATELVFKTGASAAADAKMTLTSGGDLLVGKTSTATGAGFEARSDGQIVGTRSANRVAFLNRLTSDGDIVQFAKDSTTVGSIGTDSGDLTVGNLSGHTGIRFATNALMPTDSGSISDGTESLGSDSYRWNNLYLSGGVYLGGTGSANKLDDYEEGTWTPAITGASANPSSLAYGSQDGEYTKVGRQVTVHFRISTTAGSGGSGTFGISGLPFTPSSIRSSAVISFSRKITNGGGPLTVHSYTGTASFNLYKYTDADDFDTAIEISDVTTFGSLVLHGSLTYYAT